MNTRTAIVLSMVLMLAGGLSARCGVRNGGQEGAKDQSERLVRVDSNGVDELEFTVTQKSSKAIPGSDGRLRLKLHDITRGQVRTAVLQTENGREITSTSASAGDEIVFPYDGQTWRIRVKELRNFLFEDDYGVFTVSRGGQAPRRTPKAEDGIIDVVSFPDDLDVRNGEPFKEWMKKHAWTSKFGSPEFFFIRDGALHLVSKPGPVFENRYSLALTDRDKLIEGMENKVLLQVAGGPDFRVPPDEFPSLHFKMTPVELPGSEADLRDPDRNDSAFYLLVGFDTERHRFEGRQMPETIAYVWANGKWDKPVGRDPDYSAFLRYIPIGYGRNGLGEAHEIRRNLRRDYRTAFSVKKGEPVPEVISIGIMIDSNTVKGTAESVLHWIRLRKEAHQSSGVVRRTSRDLFQGSCSGGTFSRVGHTVLRRPARSPGRGR